MIEKVINSFDSLTRIQKILVLIILATVIYAGSASLSFSVFSKVIPTAGVFKNGKILSLPGPSSVVEEDPTEPKTEKCPLNGALKTRSAKEAWEKRRPLAVMIENHSEARPQSGLTSADIVYEAVAEGGITRFMAIFYCNLSDVQVGPVRSARTYFLDWLSEYDALYAHVGGANTPGPADALSQIIKYGVRDLNQFSIGFPVFWRDYQRLGHAVATEHTMYSTTQKLWEVGAKRGWTATDSGGIRWDANFVPWNFKEDSTVQPSLEKATNITVNFWESQPNYSVEWNYEPTTNTYKRENGEPHMDMNNKEQLEASVIIVQFQRESNANDGYPGNVHLLYGTSGAGKALIFQDGGVYERKWSKISRTSKSKYLDEKGKEMEFNKGQIWIQTVPEGSDVSF